MVAEQDDDGELPRVWLRQRNEEPRPFVWTTSADEILASVARFCAHTLAGADS